MDSPSWYVFSIMFRKEVEIRDDLRKNCFEAYVPMRYTLVTVNGRKIRKLVPAIYGLVFVRGEKEKLLGFRETSALRNFMYLKSIRLTDGTLQYLTIRDDDMLNFQRLNDVKGAKLTYYKPEELRIAKGEKVKIMDGPFEGITGVVEKLPGKKGQYLIVSLPNVAVAAVKLKPQYVEPLSPKIEKSKDVLKDSRLLSTSSLQLLMGNEAEPYAPETVNEIKLLRAALTGCKTFLANDKANFFFAFYVSDIILGLDSAEHRKLLQEVLPKLKPNNLILPLTYILFYKEGKDEALEEADKIIGKWSPERYTTAQKQIMILRKNIVAQTKDGASSK